MFSFIRHPFLAPEIISFMPDSEEGSSPLPRDVRLLPWSHNILAAMWHHVHLSLKGTVHRCGRQAQGQTPGPSLPPTHLVLCTHTSALGLPPTHQGAWLWRPCMCKAFTCYQLHVTTVNHAGYAGGPCPSAHACCTPANRCTWIPEKTPAPIPVTSSSQNQLYSIRHETKE